MKLKKFGTGGGGGAEVFSKEITPRIAIQLLAHILTETKLGTAQLQLVCQLGKT